VRSGESLLDRGALRKITPKITADPQQSIPLLYGRRRFAGRLIEQGLRSWGGVQQRFAVYILCEGPIDSVVRYYMDGQVQGDVVTGGIKKIGIFYRVGAVGVDDDETVGEYNADPTTQLRAQNRDFRSSTGTTNSETAYAILVWENTPDAAEAPQQVAFDIKGLKVQKYTSSGAVDGSPVWSENPAWQLVDLFLSDKHGRGLQLGDVDFAVTLPSATYIEASIASTEARTTVSTTQAVATTTCLVASSEGFVAGRSLTIAGTPNTCDFVVSDVEIRLGSPTTQTSGQAVVQQPPRLACNLLKDDRGDVGETIAAILDTSRLFLTYDAGKVQIRCERDHCFDQLLDGALEIWSSSTNLTNWTEVLFTGNTVNRDSSDKYEGGFSVRIDRGEAANYTGIEQSLTGLQPGAWYMVRLAHKTTVGAGSTSMRLHIRNETKNLDLSPDGITWAAPTVDAIADVGASIWTEWAMLFRTKAEFASSDTYKIRLAPYFGAGHSVWFDAVQLYGPIAGHFADVASATRDEVGYTNAMGILEGTFEWATEGKNREVNRVAVRFVNEGGDVGPDEVEVNDFPDQIEKGRVVTLRLSLDGVADRDQAYRLGAWQLAKARTYETGARLGVGPAGLAIQPGDVILVTHAVPGWSMAPKRVTKKSVMGLGSQDELCVALEVEDYVEAVYADLGPSTRGIPARPTPVLTLTVVASTAQRVELSWQFDDAGYMVSRYVLHRSKVSSFTPNRRTGIAITTDAFFTYHAQRTEIGDTLYFLVEAVTDRGTIRSGEAAAFVSATGSDDMDPGGDEGLDAVNLVFGGDFDDAADWTSSAAGTESAVAPNSSTGDWTNPANAYDGTPGTVGAADGTVAEANSEDETSHTQTFSWASATKIGRVRLRARRVAGSGTIGGTFKAYYSVNSGGSYTQFAQVVGTVNADYYSADLGSVALGNFRVRLINAPKYFPITDTYTGHVSRAADLTFLEQTTGGGYAVVSENVATVRGNGTDTYGSLTRPFPGEVGPVGVYFRADEPGVVQFIAKRQTAGSAPTHALEIVLIDNLSGTEWVLGSLAAGSIGDGWGPFSFQFAHGTEISGDLDIQIRTKSSNGIQVDQIDVHRGTQARQWTPNPEDSGSFGYYGDAARARVIRWDKGPWTGAVKTGTVS